MSESKIEEIISALWFIAAFVAKGAGLPEWVFITLIVKAGLDSCCAIYFAVKEIRQETDKPSNP